jgi:Type IV Pilus-assembly protein W
MNRRRFSGLAGNRQVGRSIVEFMIAIGIGLAISAAIVAMYLSTRSTAKTQDAQQQAADNGRYALLVVGRAIRQAGYTPKLFVLDPNKPAAKSRTLELLSPTNFVPFFSCSGGFSNPTVAVTFNPVTNPGCNNTAAPDAFLVRFTTDLKQSATGAVTPDYDANRGTGVDCMGNAVQTNANNPNFYVENRYYVNASNELVCAGSGGAAPSTAPQPLVQGVEDLTITLGVDRNSSVSALGVRRDMSVDNFVPSSNVGTGPGGATEWTWGLLNFGDSPDARRVLSAQVCMLIRSQDRVSAAGVSQTYRTCRGGTAVSADGFFRQPFTSVFVLRNNIGDPS